MYKQITKREAKRLFANGEDIVLCPCKMVPGEGWAVHSTVRIQPFLDDWYNLHQEGDEFWKGSIEETVWSLMYNSWRLHNTCYEMGYYAHYYVVDDCRVT